MSELPPPEPMERILAELDGLEEGGYLRVLHRRLPHLLFPVLERRSFLHYSAKGRTHPFEIFIWRGGDSTARDAVLQAAFGLEKIDPESSPPPDPSCPGGGAQ